MCCDVLRNLTFFSVALRGIFLYMSFVRLDDHLRFLLQKQDRNFNAILNRYLYLSGDILISLIC